MNAALSLRSILPPDSLPETLPPPSGARATTSGGRSPDAAASAGGRGPDASIPPLRALPTSLSALASIDEDDAYATIDIPSADVLAGPVLLVVDAPSTGQTHALRMLRPGEELTLGASAEADVLVPDPTVSARHCAVVHHGRFVEVIDLGSRNGVRVCGARIERAMIGLGGGFEIGRASVRIEEATDISDGEASRALPGVVGRSEPMRRLGAQVRGVASLRAPILLRGESGTGKDVIARAIHAEGCRAGRPFVVLNAATIRPELAESELFGHERGAFTGAVRERRGAFREAHQGTLFLDEIAQLPLDVQAKLLRVVEEGSVRALGGETDHKVDVRLVVATCEPLEAMVREGRFRADLYQRLAVCVLRVPPLRDRTDDIPRLARHLLAASEMGHRDLTACAIAALCKHAWPGNVRELRNVLFQAAILATPGPITGRHVGDVIGSRDVIGRRKLDPAGAMRLLQECDFNVSAAARRAEMPRSSLRDLLRQAGAPLGVRKTSG